MSEFKELSNLDCLFLKKALKETPTLKVGVSVPKSMNKGFSDLPLFDNGQKQQELFSPSKTKRNGSDKA
jgi:hypothetical protein